MGLLVAAVLVIPDVAKQSFKLRSVLTKLHVRELLKIEGFGAAG
jgi:hypothetical protein